LGTNVGSGYQIIGGKTVKRDVFEGTFAHPRARSASQEFIPPGRRLSLKSLRVGKVRDLIGRSFLLPAVTGAISGFCGA